MITLTNFCQHRDECIPVPPCSCCVRHNISKQRFGVRQPSCRFSHRPARFYISRASMEAPAAGNNQTSESAVELHHSSASIASASLTKTPALPHRARGTGRDLPSLILNILLKVGALAPTKSRQKNQQTLGCRPLGFSPGREAPLKKRFPHSLWHRHSRRCSPAPHPVAAVFRLRAFLFSSPSPCPLRPLHP